MHLIRYYRAATLESIADAKRHILPLLLEHYGYFHMTVKVNPTLRLRLVLNFSFTEI